MEDFTPTLDFLETVMDDVSPLPYVNAIERVNEGFVVLTQGVLNLILNPDFEDVMCYDYYEENRDALCLIESGSSVLRQKQFNRYTQCATRLFTPNAFKMLRTLGDILYIQQKGIAYREINATLTPTQRERIETYKAYNHQLNHPENPYFNNAVNTKEVTRGWYRSEHITLSEEDEKDVTNLYQRRDGASNSSRDAKFIAHRGLQRLENEKIIPLLEQALPKEDSDETSSHLRLKPIYHQPYALSLIDGVYYIATHNRHLLTIYINQETQEATLDFNQTHQEIVTYEINPQDIEMLATRNEAGELIPLDQALSNFYQRTLNHEDTQEDATDESNSEQESTYLAFAVALVKAEIAEFFPSSESDLESTINEPLELKELKETNDTRSVYKYIQILIQVYKASRVILKDQFGNIVYVENSEYGKDGED